MQAPDLGKPSQVAVGNLELSQPSAVAVSINSYQ